MARKQLLVSIHDVTPALEAAVRALWALCRSHGITPALLVVPNWHGAWPIEHHPLFMDWVRARAREGAEIFLHGERHDEFGLPRTWRDSWRAVGRTAREGEFLTLDTEAARERIARGMAQLADQQLTPIGFIPPAWLARPSTHALVGEQGLAVSEDAASLYLHRRGQRVHAPALRWSGRTTPYALASRLTADVRWRAWRAAPLLRLALHPQDLQHAVTAASVRRDVARWSTVRDVIRYASLA